MKPVLAVMVLVLAALPAKAEEIYRWVDDKGVVHYSAPPPPGQKAERQELRYQRGDPAAAAAAQKRWSAEEQQRRERDAAAARVGASDEARAAERQKACADAREIIRRLEAGPAVRYQREDGSFMSYTPDQIESRLSEARAREQEYCD